MQVRTYLYRKYFFGWKRSAHSIRFKRFAFIHRLQVVLRKQALRRMFDAIVAAAQWSYIITARAQEVRELRLRRVFDRMKRVFLFYRVQRRNRSIMTSWMEQTTRLNVTSQLALRFRYWRVTSGLFGDWRRRERNMQGRVFHKWHQLFRSKRHCDGRLAKRALSAWRERVVRLRETRGKLMHFRHAAMPVEAR